MRSEDGPPEFSKEADATSVKLALGVVDRTTLVDSDKLVSKFCNQAKHRACTRSGPLDF